MGWDAYCAAFGALGRLHRLPPDQDELAALAEMWAQWPLPDTDAARRGLAELAAAAESGEDAETIRADHARLYGVGAKAVVAPYESVHADPDALVFDRATFSVREAYSRLGLRAPNLNREPDDHLGLEFDFLCHAGLAALDGDEAAAKAADDFYREHLSVWAPGVLARVVEAADTRFMAGVAWLSLGALEDYGAASADRASSASSG